MKEKLPLTPEEYGKYYKICDALPFAFTDIEMVFDKEKKAVDWIFRYGNEALATLEKLPLTTAQVPNKAEPVQRSSCKTMWETPAHRH